MIAKNRYVCYGGARGGGKSWALRAKITLLAARYAGIRMLLIRRTYPELESNHIMQLRAELSGFATYSEQKKRFTFANGSILQCGYCSCDADALQYQGQEYDILLIDEATQITESQFTWINSTVRGVNSFPKRTYLTCNPGGVGHEWVKRRFVDGGEPNSIFIRSLIYDNKPLMDADPEYLKFLQSIPDPELRDAWLNGNWDMFAGQFFSEFRRDIHVFDESPVLQDWYRRYIALDYGLDMLAVLWVAVDDIGNEYVYRELYEPNVLAADAADMILSLSGGEKIEVAYAPTDLRARSSDSGVSIIERFAERGFYTSDASNDRVNGWQSVKAHLKRIPALTSDGTDEDGKDGFTARLRIFPQCKNLIRCLPLLQYSQRNPNDADTEPHEITHICDALRYYCASRPSLATPPDTRTWEQKARERAINDCIRRSRRGIRG